MIPREEAGAMSRSISRRQLLTRVVHVSIGAALASAAAESASAAGPACVDLKSMSSAEIAGRNSLHWTAQSTQPDKTCSLCQFFTASPGGCGMCMILSGPTYATGYCDSWTAKQS
jgi:hypothetical protein